MATLRSTPVTQAKAQFSALWRDVVSEHRPQLVDKFGGKEAMLLVRREDIVALLDSHLLAPEVSIDEGEFIASIPGMGVFGTGQTFDAAIDELAGELRVYVADFFDRFAFYMKTDRKEHAPALLRYAATPAEQQRELLINDSHRLATSKRLLQHA
jgi:Antitoxin of toxin-antitoxin, RelE / RelB, TA system